MPFQTLGEVDESEGISAMDGQLASPASVEQTREEPRPGRGFLRSFGSLIWIALLIVFSMYRTCGE